MLPSRPGNPVTAAATKWIIGAGWSRPDLLQATSLQGHTAEGRSSSWMRRRLQDAAAVAGTRDAGGGDIGGCRDARRGWRTRRRWRLRRPWRGRRGKVEEEEGRTCTAPPVAHIGSDVGETRVARDCWVTPLCFYPAANRYAGGSLSTRFREGDLGKVRGLLTREEAALRIQFSFPAIIPRPLQTAEFDPNSRIDDSMSNSVHPNTV
jgi:hypothetical protein